MKEINFLHSCHHPNILSLYGISFDENLENDKCKIAVITPLIWRNLHNLYKILEGTITQIKIPLPFTNEIKQKMIFGITRNYIS